MFFSVIVPVYKVERYLPGCIESVLQQTFSDLELILVDDGSPDQCPAICDAYAAKDSRIKVVHKENGGLASARRAGIREAAGEYVFNLDSDDLIEPDTLETAYGFIRETGAELVSFAYRWVKDAETVKITDDGLEEGLYAEKEIESALFPKLLMDERMEHLSYYLAGKAVKRSLILPLQLNVSEKISLGEDLCCVFPCYLNAKSVYISRKAAYRYTVRTDSMSKEFNTNQIRLVGNVIDELSKNDVRKLSDFEAQLCRYDAFMCFAILASAAEGGHFKSLKALRESILSSAHRERIAAAAFSGVSPKSRITLRLMKKERYTAAFYFLYFCKLIKTLLRR